jgi:hypothetical protein
MGGYGSGRKSDQCKKGLTDYLYSIDVRAWRRDGLLTTDRRYTFRWHESQTVIVTMNATVDSDSIFLDITCDGGVSDSLHDSQYISLSWTECHFGGERPWFRCPVRGCWNRVAILYFAGTFACRECCNLAYASQRQSPNTRASNRVNKIREKLGWQPGFLNGVEWKPKGMHWKTFGRLVREHENEVARAKILLVHSLGLKHLLEDPFE